MAYIPNEDKKYKVLPYSRKNNKEVIEYISDDYIREINNLTNNELSWPYNCSSYDEYYKGLEDLSIKYPNAKKKIIKFLNLLKNVNIKENWIILKYIGNSNDNFTKDQCYYMPVYLENDNWIHLGIIDNEEFTSCIDWEEGNIINFEKDFVVVKNPHNIKF